MEEKKLLVLLFLFLNLLCLMDCVSRNDARRRRRATCQGGQYTTNKGLACCLCPEGTYVKSDCTSTHTAPECAACANQTFQDQSNSEGSCEPCKTCGINDNKVVEKNCTSTSDAVCRCMDGYYCGNECKVCHACTTCEFGVNVSCSLTSDAQCNQKPPENPNVIIVPIVITTLIIIAAAAAAVFIVWKKKLLCWKPAENVEQPELEPLDDPDLREVLPKISEFLGFKVVRSVVRRQNLLTQATIDNIMDENPRDAGERAYQLLSAWYEKHGMRGASKTLCENLIAIHMRSKAEAVHTLIHDELKKREVETNGDV